MKSDFRFTARGIIVREKDLLLMERWRRGEHYFSIPGGQIEPNESPEQAVIREVMEETTIACNVIRPLLELRLDNARHIVFECEYLSGEPTLLATAEESSRSLQENFYNPKWVPIDSLAELPFGYWEPLQQLLISGLRSGFAQKVPVVTL